MQVRIPSASNVLFETDALLNWAKRDDVTPITRVGGVRQRIKVPDCPCSLLIASGEGIRVLQMDKGMIFEWEIGQVRDYRMGYHVRREISVLGMLIYHRIDAYVAFLRGSRLACAAYCDAYDFRFWWSLDWILYSISLMRKVVHSGYSSVNEPSDESSGRIGKSTIWCNKKCSTLNWV